MLSKLSFIYILLNFKGYIGIKYSLSFIIIFAKLITSFFLLTKLLSVKIDVLSIYILIIPNISV